MPEVLPALSSAHGGDAIDLLLHNAGINNGSLERQMEVNAIAPFRLVDALMPALMRSQHKRVCIITSDRGQHYYVRRFQARFNGKRGAKRCRDVPYCSYAVSKGAAHETFRRLEPTWRARGITRNGGRGVARARLAAATRPEPNWR